MGIKKCLRNAPIWARNGVNLQELLENEETDTEKRKSLYGAKTCLNCVKREFCQKLCKEIEKILPKMNTGRMGGKLTIVTPFLIQKQLYHSKISGKRRTPIIYNDNLTVFDDTP